MHQHEVTLHIAEDEATVTRLVRALASSVHVTQARIGSQPVNLDGLELPDSVSLASLKDDAGRLAVDAADEANPITQAHADRVALAAGLTPEEALAHGQALAEEAAAEPVEA